MDDDIPMGEEGHFLELIEALPAIVWRGPAEAIGIAFVNRAAETILGYPREAWTANATFWREHVHPDDVRRVVARCVDCERARRPYTDEYRMVAADGRSVWLRETVQFLHPAGGPVEVVGVMTDVSAEKVAAESLRESRERSEHLAREAQQAAAALAAVVESSQDAIFSIDLQGRVVSWNPASQRISGFAADEVLGRQIGELLPPDRQRDLDAVQRVLGGSPGLRYESEALRKDGSQFSVSVSISSVRDEGGSVIGASSIVRDISERRLREHERDNRLNRLAALRSVDLAISASLDLRIAGAVILQQMTGSLGLDAGALLLFDPDSKMLRYAAGRGFVGGAIRHTDLRLGQSLAGQALLSRRPVYCLDSPETLSGDLSRAEVFAEERVFAYAACPLIAKGRPVGVLEGFHRGPLEIDSEWRDFFETLAVRAAIAVDTVSLFDGLERSNAHLTVAYDSAIEGWSRALDLRDKETEGHSRRVTDLTLRLARAMGLRDTELVQIRRGALLHDIGKLGIPDAILHKPGELSEEEWVIMRRHPQLGRDLLAPIPYLRPALDIPYGHHEKWDGSGYPQGLAGSAIPLAARIFAVADVFDALRSDRPYRSGWALERTIEHIAGESGRHFDPRVVEAFLSSSLAETPAR